MRSTMFVLATASALACGSDPVVDPSPPANNLPAVYTTHHGALRSPCVASDLALVVGLRLRCSGLPYRPGSGDDDLWRGPLPSSGHFAYATGEPTDSTYDHTTPYEIAHGTYRSDGNIDQYSVPELSPEGPPPEVRYTYDGSTLIGAELLEQGARTLQVEVAYEDGRRSYEGVVGEPMQRRLYTYDERGELTQIVGAGVRDALPTRPDESVLGGDCPTTIVPAPSGDGDATVRYYYRDDAGRIIGVVQSTSTGFRMHRVTFEYDGDELVRAVRTCTESNDPTQGDVVVTYTYP